MPERRISLSEHFYLDEFRCRDGTPVPRAYIPDLRDLCETYLEPMRRKFGPCNVHSGFRTDAWNARIGGARLSFHVYTDRPPGSGVAADVSFAKGSPAEWHRRAKRIRRFRQGGRGGLGRYDAGGFVHVDNRNYAADWEGP